MQLGNVNALGIRTGTLLVKWRAPISTAIAPTTGAVTLAAGSVVDRGTAGHAHRLLLHAARRYRRRRPRRQQRRPQEDDRGTGSPHRGKHLWRRHDDFRRHAGPRRGRHAGQQQPDHTTRRCSTRPPTATPATTSPAARLTPAAPRTSPPTSMARSTSTTPRSIGAAAPQQRDHDHQRKPGRRRRARSTTRPAIPSRWAAPEPQRHRLHRPAGRDGHRHLYALHLQ